MALTACLQVWVSAELADIRFGIAGLARSVRQAPTENSFSGALLVFRNRRPLFPQIPSPVLTPEHLVYESVKPDPGGSVRLMRTPLELLDRLAALISPPLRHRHLDFGVLGAVGPPMMRRRACRKGPEGRLNFIRETLVQFPTLTASRLYVRVKERGYPGRPDHFRHLVALHRPRPRAETYLRLSTLPGEQAQVDWGHFGHLEIGRARRAMTAFVMMLAWLRMIYLHFFLAPRLPGLPQLRFRFARADARAELRALFRDSQDKSGD